MYSILVIWSFGVRICLNFVLKILDLTFVGVNEIKLWPKILKVMKHILLCKI